MEPLCEVCVDSVTSAVNAQAAGAARVELCADLFEGGITPSLGMAKLVKDKISIGIHIIIRPRAGDFCYSDDEMKIMKFDIEEFKKIGAGGVVIGVLSPEGEIDVSRTKELVEAALPMKVTFHRAFDLTRDPIKALEDIIAIGGIQRILTSGQDSSCLEGIDLLTELVDRASDRIIIMPGGGITEKNITKIMKQTRATEFHVSGRVTQDGPMLFRNKTVFMGGALRPAEYSLSVVDPKKVQAFIANSKT